MAVPEIDATAAQARVAAGEAVLLDVREQAEWDSGRIAGAIHIPLAELVSRQDEIPERLPLVVVCRSGGRSAYAVELLLRAGYDAVNLAGGMKAWHAARLGLEPVDGFVA